MLFPTFLGSGSGGKIEIPLKPLQRWIPPLASWAYEVKAESSFHAVAAGQLCPQVPGSANQCPHRSPGSTAVPSTLWQYEYMLVRRL